MIPDRKPQQAHLKVYGCKAFALTTEYPKKEKRLHRFNPKAWIGYLVGYDSTNVYRIWNPIKNTVILRRESFWASRTNLPKEDRILAYAAITTRIDTLLEST